MGKILRLNEDDITRIVKRVINEQNKMKIASEIINSPKLNDMVDKALSKLNPREFQNLKSSLKSLGVSSNMNITDAIKIADDVVNSTPINNSTEIDEDDEKIGLKKQIKDGVFFTLGALGLTNMVLFGLPISFLIDELLNENFIWGGTAHGISMVLSFLFVIIGGLTLGSNKK